MKLDFDAIIVGAGVSGMSASIYLKRAGIKFLLLEQNYPGGQLNMANNIENYPGFSSIDGPTLVLNIVDQMKQMGIDICYEKVLDIEDAIDYKIVKTNKQNYKTKALVLATGRIPRKLGLENENLLIGKGISWCANCDGFLYKDKSVAVIGGGNTAIDALYLSNFCKKVYIINRSTNFRATAASLDKAKSTTNISVIENRVVKKLNINDDLLCSIELDDNQEIKISGLFEAIGSIPNISYAKNLNIDIEDNYIIVDENMQTSNLGVYASGDTIKKDLYQIVTAISEGAVAANSLIKYIK